MSLVSCLSRHWRGDWETSTPYRQLLEQKTPMYAAAAACVAATAAAAAAACAGAAAGAAGAASLWWEGGVLLSPLQLEQQHLLI